MSADEPRVYSADRQTVNVTEWMRRTRLVHGREAETHACEHTQRTPTGIHRVGQKTSTSLFFNNSVKNEPILIIFGTLNPEKI